MSRRFVPQLDCLDGRALPSATVTAADGVLDIRGDSAPNSIRITDDGAAGTRNIVVEVDGQRFEPDGPIDEIRVNGGGGGDNIRYTLTTDLSSPRLVEVNLGNGHDTFAAEARGAVTETGDLTIRANGQNGRDTLSFVGDADVRGGLTVDLNGGNGRDALDIDYSGLLAGRADLGVVGGNGRDLIDGTIIVDPASEGRLSGEFLGGNGRDTGEVIVGGTERLTFSDPPVVDGGRGQDDIITRGEVDVVPEGR
ncbi:MAG TPA: hypothetical protein VM597_06905 [Gemmataceae bacterium]|nr:hypothetical protein [Gemmataceae bacterium]